MQKKLKKSFATLSDKIKEMNEDESDITDSNTEDKVSHFQCHITGLFYDKKREITELYHSGRHIRHYKKALIFLG